MSDEGKGALVRHLGGSRRELLLGILAAAISMLVIGRLARDFWFRYDHFYFLAGREAGSFDDWLRPHAGHWTLWTNLQYRTLGALVGTDFWPWYYLSRLFGHAALSFLLWRILLWRGTSRLVAAGCYGAMLVMATSYFHDALTVGNYFVFAGVAVAALLIDEVDQPHFRHLAVVAVCLLAGLIGNGYGLSVYLAVLIVAVSTHRARRWAAALIPPGAVYFVWYLWYRGSFPTDSAPLNPNTVIDAVQPTFVVIRTTAENSLGLPGLLAAAAVVAMIVFVVSLLVRRRLDRFDGVIALTLVLTLASLAVARTVTRPSTATEGRYGYAVALLTILLVVPHLPAPRRAVTQVATAALLMAVIAFNLVSLRDRIDEREAVSQQIRAEAETSAAFIRDGEPYVTYARYPSRVVPRLIQELVDDGWTPEASTDPLVVAAVRSGMRFAVPPEDRAEDLESDPGEPPSAPGTDADGCVHVGAGESIALTVTGEGAFTVNGLIRLSWIDQFGTATRLVQDALVGVAAPVGDVEVTASSVQRRAADLCGFRVAGDPP